MMTEKRKVTLSIMFLVMFVCLGAFLNYLNLPKYSWYNFLGIPALVTELLT